MIKYKTYVVYFKKYLTVRLTVFEIVSILLKPKEEQLKKRNHQRGAQKSRLISPCNCTVVHI
jgi:hypothetical protein